MKHANTLNEKWIKASIIGTTWAASEIVLGSFLHNLKVPFSGNLLTAIGLIILISASYIWAEKGLFWRAGIICAIMKTMSPSAVIFGPMIAIFSESVLLEIFVRLLGKNVVGYVLGSMFAMSWNLFQKIINFIIFYSYDIVRLYADLVKYAQKQLNVQTDIAWLPIIVLLAAYCGFGILSAVIGIKTGRKILKQPVEGEFNYKSDRDIKKIEPKQSEFKYSWVWLFADIVMMTGSLFLLKYSWPFWLTVIPVIVTIWAIRYKRAFRQLSKPKFWLFFILITFISAFVFTKMQTGVNSTGQGILIGIQMNFRALIVILGFSVLGTELYNPGIRQFFMKTSFKQLPLALELSFESLPLMIANMPDFKTIIRNPVSVIYKVVLKAELRLAEIKNKLLQKVFIISGAVEQGKTTQVKEIIEVLKERNISVGGIYSPRIIENGVTIGYNIVDITDDYCVDFLRIDGEPGLDKIGRFSILPKGLSTGKTALLTSNNTVNKVVIIDEVGALELDNKGWAENISDLITASESHLLLSVKDSLTDRVIKKWNFREYYVYKLAENDSIKISNSILDLID